MLFSYTLSKIFKENLSIIFTLICFIIRARGKHSQFIFGLHNHMTLKELEKEYRKRQFAWKVHIRCKPTKAKRFFAWVWYLIAFPFVWLFYNCRDYRSVICILISFLLWSASVWVWYVLAICTGWDTDIAKWFIGIGSAVWVWWASPIGSPFILLVTITSIGMKALFNKIKGKKHGNK